MNGDILFYAFRYALGRRTHAVSTVTKEINHHAPHLSDRVKKLMMKEIDEAYKNNALGAQCDQDMWHRTRAKLADTFAHQTIAEPSKPHPCSDPGLNSVCTGCTDEQSEGTHQGCTKQHGHIGCDKDVRKNHGESVL